MIAYSICQEHRFSTQLETNKMKMKSPFHIKQCLQFAGFAKLRVDMLDRIKSYILAAMKSILIENEIILFFMFLRSTLLKNR